MIFQCFETDSIDFMAIDWHFPIIFATSRERHIFASFRWQRKFGRFFSLYIYREVDARNWLRNLPHWIDS